MSEISSWMQSNWYGLGTFLVEVAFLAAGVWFARNILKMMRSFQEQVGALLKLTITPAPTERDPSLANRGENAPHNMAAQSGLNGSLLEATPYWMALPETQPIPVAEAAESGPSRFALAWGRLAAAGRRTAHWLNEPMMSVEAGPWRRLVTWLQTPARS